jgi:type VI secretion system protein ImpG
LRYTAFQEWWVIKTTLIERFNFQPFYAAADIDRRGAGAYFSVRREQRLLSEKGKRNGPRTGYIGSECFVTLVDANEAPYSADLRQVTVEALCTNRDLSLLTPLGNAGSDLTLLVSAPVDDIRFVAGPTRPTAALAEREITWRLISHLSLNYLTLTDLSAEEGASALRELLGLYARLGAQGADAQIGAIQKLAVKSVNRRVPGRGPIVFRSRCSTGYGARRNTSWQASAPGCWVPSLSSFLHGT